MIEIEEIKQDFLSEYSDVLCDESVEDINNTETLESFVGVLKKYMCFVYAKPIPTSLWVRKWFANDKDEINKYGVYLDQSLSLTNPEEKLVLFGSCGATMVFTEPKLWNIMLCETSMITIMADGVCDISIRKKDNSSVMVTKRTNGARIKVHDI